jgi:hypothetical protein
MTTDPGGRTRFIDHRGTPILLYEAKDWLVAQQAPVAP